MSFIICSWIPGGVDEFDDEVDDLWARVSYVDDYGVHRHEFKTWDEAEEYIAAEPSNGHWLQAIVDTDNPPPHPLPKRRTPKESIEAWMKRNDIRERFGALAFFIYQGDKCASVSAIAYSMTREPYKMLVRAARKAGFVLT